MLSIDTLVEIANYLDPVSIVRLSSTCKWYRVLIKKTKVLAVYGMSLKFKKWNHCMFLACKEGNWCAMNFFIEKGATDFSSAAAGAIHGRHSEMLEYLLDKYEIDYRVCMDASVRADWIEMIKKFGTMSSPDHRQVLGAGMFVAVEKKRIDIIEMLISFGLKEKSFTLSQASYYATREGDIDMLKYLIDKGVDDLYYAMAGAVFENQKEIADYILKMGYSADKSLGIASEFENTEMIDYFISKGANILDACQIGAASRGRLGTVKHLYEAHGVHSNGALQCAALDGQLEVVKLFIENGNENQIEECLRLAQLTNQGKVIEYLKRKIEENDSRKPKKRRTRK